jgi:hypothetical protein
LRKTDANRKPEEAADQGQRFSHGQFRNPVITKEFTPTP